LAKLNYSDCVTNLNPTDLKYRIRIRRIPILAGSMISLSQTWSATFTNILMTVFQVNLNK